MRKCPRCHTSMVMDYEDCFAGRRRAWKCLGCGQEILQDMPQSGDRIQEARQLAEKLRQERPAL